MNETLTISVVMPSYNHAHFIRESIESVLSQDYPHIELLVMDGGSSDGTVDILKSYGDKLRYVSEKDRGQSDAINKGFSRVHGDIVCWLNSDDLFTPHAVNVVMKIFAEHPDVDYVYGNGWTIDEQGAMLGDSGVLPFNLWKLIHQRNFLQQPSVFFRKSLLDRAGMIDETLHFVMDWELWIRFSAYKWYFTKEFLSCNRTYNENKTQSGHFRRWREIYSVVRRYTDAVCPPILPIYFLEVSIHFLASKRVPHRMLTPMLNLLVRLMLSEMSGWYSDGRIRNRFSVSIGNPEGKNCFTVRMKPLSGVSRGRIGASPVTFSWRSATGDKGFFSLIENGQVQEFTLPLSHNGKRGFHHFTFTADYEGEPLTGTDNVSVPNIVGFLDGVTC